MSEAVRCPTLLSKKYQPAVLPATKAEALALATENDEHVAAAKEPDMYDSARQFELIAPSFGLVVRNWAVSW